MAWLRTIVAILATSTVLVAEDAAPDTNAIQVVTLADGRVLEGRLNADRTQLVMVDAKTGKDLATVSIHAEDVTSVVERIPAPTEDPEAKAADAKLTPEEKALAGAERKVLAAVNDLNRAKQRNADAVQADITWDRTEGGKAVHSKAAFDSGNARLERIHKEVAAAATGMTDSQHRYDACLADYKKLGGTRDFAPLLKEPKPPK